MSQTTTEPRVATQTVRRESRLTHEMQKLLGDLAQLPPYEQAPDLYSDWGEEEFKVQVGRGECAQ